MKGREGLKKHFPYLPVLPAAFGEKKVAGATGLSGLGLEMIRPQDLEGVDDGRKKST